jgi:hypothetical protein
MVADDEAQLALLKPDVESPVERVATPKRREIAWVHWVAHVLLLSILIVVTTTREAQCSSDNGVPSLQDSLPREALKTSPVRFNGSIDFRSEWKGIPRTELENAWNSVTYDGEPA